MVRGTSSTCLFRIAGGSYPRPPSSLAEHQQEPQAPTRTFCNARAAGRAAETRQTNPDFGDHSFITAISNTQAGTKLRSGTQTHRKWGPGAGRQHETLGAQGIAGEAARGTHAACAPRGREETLHIWEALGWQRGTGAEPAHHRTPPLPLAPEQGLSRAPKALGCLTQGERGGLTPPTRLPPPHPGHKAGQPPHHRHTHVYTQPCSFPRAAGPPAPPAEPNPGAAARGPRRPPPTPLPRPANHLKGNAEAPAAPRLP